ncbi:regulator of g protein signaling [Anaeramoeba flamelloides]|uniref:Regulator of g protein signaling n=1 Tax=Anaeramoeba flamelloides TaxID=1746091 RepID=A0ABQ8YMG7_9EUKA|nr:regulator of g protein signaling [Anaeramoeba flamelloides]
MGDDNIIQGDNPGKGETTFIGVFLLVSWVIFTPFFMLTFYLFIKRRNKQPIKARSPTLLSLSSVAAYIVITHNSLSIWYGTEHWPCIISFWLTYLIIPWYFLPYIFRCLRLFFIFNINSQKALTNSGTGNDKQSWLMRRRKWFSDKHLLRWLYLLCFGLFAFGLYRQFIDERNYPDRYGCATTETAIISLSAFFGPFLALIIFSIWFLRSIRDEFNINKELKIITFVWIVTIVPYLVLSYIGNVTVSALLSVYYNAITYIVSDVHPLYLSYIGAERIKVPSSSILSSLDNVLKDEHAHDAFKDFLVQEFSVENILFWDEVEDFKKLAERDEIKERARYIYDKYIDPSSVFEVNLDSNDKEQIKKSLKKTTIDMYNEPQNSIFDLMESDSWPRFLKSNLCKDLIHKFHADENLFEILREAGLV